MKFKLLKPRRRRRPKRKPLPPEIFAALAQRRAQALRRKPARQSSRRQTVLRLACAREITTREPRGRQAERCPAGG